MQKFRKLGKKPMSKSCNRTYFHLIYYSKVLSKAILSLLEILCGCIEVLNLQITLVLVFHLVQIVDKLLVLLPVEEDIKLIYLKHSLFQKKAVINSMALKIEEHMSWLLKICKTRILLSFKSWKKKRRD